jgi:hypothetical protein
MNYVNEVAIMVEDGAEKGKVGTLGSPFFQMS